jgi:hypothetical protein
MSYLLTERQISLAESETYQNLIILYLWRLIAASSVKLFEENLAILLLLDFVSVQFCSSLLERY